MRKLGQQAGACRARTAQCARARQRCQIPVHTTVGLPPPRPLQAFKASALDIVREYFDSGKPN